MPKRTSDVADLPQAKQVANGQPQASRIHAGADVEMGEFEDRWEDDIESDDGVEEEIVDAAEAEGEDGDDVGESPSRDSEVMIYCRRKDRVAQLTATCRVHPCARGRRTTSTNPRDVPTRYQTRRRRAACSGSISLPRPPLPLIRMALPLIRRPQRRLGLGPSQVPSYRMDRHWYPSGRSPGARSSKGRSSSHASRRTIQDST